MKKPIPMTSGISPAAAASAEGATNPVVKRFDNIPATPRGRIELSFIPVVNYPIVNAIEVLAEPSNR